MLTYGEYVFAALFTIEMVIKLVGYGAFTEASTNTKAGYFRNTWNRLDFFIVITQYVSFIPGVDNITALRALRVLRPLKTLNVVPGLKLLVQTVLDSVSGLFSVFLLISFFLLMFSILGMQLWSGVLHYRCLDSVALRTLSSVHLLFLFSWRKLQVWIFRFLFSLHSVLG